MGKSIILLISLLYIAGAATIAAQATPLAATKFIKDSCKATRYPELCVQSLISYTTTIQQSPQQLAQIALTVSLAKAQSIKTMVSTIAQTKGMKNREYETIKDCLNQVTDSVDRLSRSIKEMGQIGQTHHADFVFHMSNVQTWVSGALTDDTTCLDGITSITMTAKAKDTFQARFVDMAQVTSNALALINQFAEKP